MRASIVCLGNFFGAGALQLPQSAHGQAGGREVASAPEAETDRLTAQVTVDGRALFRVRGFSAYPAEERAEGIAKRIVTIANDPAVAPGSLHTVEEEHATNILAGDRIIMAITDADVSLEGVSRPLLAKAFILRISEAITAYRQERTPRRLLMNTAYALGATAVLGIVLVLVRRLFRRLDAVAEKRLKSRVEGLRIQSFQIVQTELLWKSLRTAFRTARTLATLACFLLVRAGRPGSLSLDASDLPTPAAHVAGSAAHDGCGPRRDAAQSHLSGDPFRGGALFDAIDAPVF